jgi:hypothetical protein
MIGMKRMPGPGSSIAAGLLAAVGASGCCVGPLVLLGLGIGGAWVAHLTALEPLRPLLALVAVAFLALAFRGLYLQPARCEPGARVGFDAGKASTSGLVKATTHAGDPSRPSPTRPR